MHVLNFASDQNCLLGRNAAYGFARDHAFAFYRQKSLYTFIPKNACSTLRFSLAVANGHLPPDGDVDWIHANNPTFVASQEFIATCAHSFVVLRCPFRRLASCYLDKIVGGERHLRNLLPPLTRGFHRARGRAALARRVQALSFADFLRHVAGQAPDEMDSHWRPQVDFLLLRDYDDYLALEQFGQARDRLAQRGIEVLDTRDRLGHDTSALRRVTGGFARVPGTEIARMKAAGEVPDPAGLYDDETISLVRRVYRRDIALYRERFGPAGMLF